MADVAGIMKTVRPLARKIAGMVKRGIIERIDDTKGTQTVQVSLLSDEVADGAEHMQPHGLSFHPPAGADVVVFAANGDPAHLIALAASQRGSRPTGVDEGEGGLHYLGEFKVFLAADGSVHLGAQTGAAKMARADRVEAELEKIKTTLGSLSAGDQTFGTPYSVVGSVGADNVHGT